MKLSNGSPPSLCSSSAGACADLVLQAYLHHIAIDRLGRSLVPSLPQVFQVGRLRSRSEVHRAVVYLWLHILFAVVLVGPVVTSLPQN